VEAILTGSWNILAGITGTPPVGYRAPLYEITRETSLSQERVEVGVQGAVEDGGFGLAALIGRRRTDRGHGPPGCREGAKIGDGEEPEDIARCALASDDSAWITGSASLFELRLQILEQFNRHL
jgi:hypothetical protein